MKCPIFNNLKSWLSWLSSFLPELVWRPNRKMIISIYRSARLKRNRLRKAFIDFQRKPSLESQDVRILFWDKHRKKYGGGVSKYQCQTDIATSKKTKTTDATLRTCRNYQVISLCTSDIMLKIGSEISNMATFLLKEQESFFGFK